MANTRRPSGARAEATNDGVHFTFDGAPYTIAGSDSWDLDAIEAAELGNIVTATRLILGETQWKRFRSKPRTVGDLNRLFDTLRKAAGIPGN